MIDALTIGGFAVSAGLAAAYGGWLTFAPESAWRSAVKTGAVGVLACVAVTFAPVLLVAALAFGALGDFCLSRRGKAAFLAGLCSFAVAHLGLVAVFWPQDGFGWVGIFPVIAAALVGAIVVPKAGALRGAVAVYVLIIAAMGVVAVQPENAGAVTIGAVLFMVSDACLGLSLFVLAPSRPVQKPLQPVIWFSYWAAQMAFLLAFVPSLGR